MIEALKARPDGKGQTYERMAALKKVYTERRRAVEEQLLPLEVKVGFFEAENKAQIEEGVPKYLEQAKQLFLPVDMSSSLPVQTLTQDNLNTTEGRVKAVATLAFLSALHNAWEEATEPYSSFMLRADQVASHLDRARKTIPSLQYKSPSFVVEGSEEPMSAYDLFCYAVTKGFVRLPQKLPEAINTLTTYTWQGRSIQYTEDPGESHITQYTQVRPIFLQKGSEEAEAFGFMGVLGLYKPHPDRSITAFIPEAKIKREIGGWQGEPSGSTYNVFPGVFDQYLIQFLEKSLSSRRLN